MGDGREKLIFACLPNTSAASVTDTTSGDMGVTLLVIILMSLYLVFYRISNSRKQFYPPTRPHCAYGPIIKEDTAVYMDASSNPRGDRRNLLIINSDNKRPRGLNSTGNSNSTGASGSDHTDGGSSNKQSRHNISPSEEKDKQLRRADEARRYHLYESSES
jgi:hypothetical protein